MLQPLLPAVATDHAAAATVAATLAAEVGCCLPLLVQLSAMLPILSGLYPTNAVGWPLCGVVGSPFLRLIHQGVCQAGV